MDKRKAYSAYSLEWRWSGGGDTDVQTDHFAFVVLKQPLETLSTSMSHWYARKSEWSLYTLSLDRVSYTVSSTAITHDRDAWLHLGYSNNKLKKIYQEY